MELIEKLVFISRYANGIFCSGQVTEEQKDRTALYMLRKRKPEFFNVLWQAEPIEKLPLIFQLSQHFCNLHSPGTFVTPILGKIEICKYLAWSGISLDWNYPNPFPEKGCLYRDKYLVIDSFDQNIEQLFDKEKFVITLPFRMEYLSSYGIMPMIAQSFNGGWTKRTLIEFFKNYQESSISSATWIKSLFPEEDDWITGMIWPSDDSECHTDARDYAGFDGPISGITKWKHDKKMAMLLKENGKGPKDYNNYKFGVYPKSEDAT